MVTVLNVGVSTMYYSDYTELKAQKRVLEKAFKQGRVSEEIYNQKTKELDGKIEDYEMESKLKDVGALGTKIRNGHYVINLRCPCKHEGTVTYGRMDYKLLGKDVKGFLYFECPKCRQHLQYDPMSGKTRTRKGILGFLFGRFS